MTGYLPDRIHESAWQPKTLGIARYLQDLGSGQISSPISSAVRMVCLSGWVWRASANTSRIQLMGRVCTNGLRTIRLEVTKTIGKLRQSEGKRSGEVRSAPFPDNGDYGWVMAEYLGQFEHFSVTLNCQYFGITRQ